MSGFDDGASQASSRRSRASAIGADMANSSKQLNFPEPTATHVLTKYFPIFPLFKTYKQANMQLVVAIAMFMIAMQHWAFLINPHFSDDWGSVVGGAVAKALYGAMLPFYDPAEITALQKPTILILYVYVSLVLVLVVIGCTLFHLTRKEDTEEAKGATAMVARILLDLLASVLFIPILVALFNAMICGKDGQMWLFPNSSEAQCWSGTHIAVFVPSLITMLLLLPLVYLKKMCIYDYNPLNDNFTAMRYSTTDKITFFHDVIACFLFTLMTAYDAVSGFAVLMAINAAVLVVAYIFFLPFYSVGVTRFYVVVHALELLAAVFLAASTTNYPFTHSALGATLLLGTGLLFLLFLMLITDYRINPNFIFSMRRSQQCLPAAASVPFDEEKMDYMNFEDPSDNQRQQLDDLTISQLPYPRGLVTTEEFSQYVGLNQQVLESIMRQGITAYMDSLESPQETGRIYPVLESYIDRVYTPTDVALAASFLDEFSAVFGTGQATSAMKLFAANIYSRALVTFPDDPDVILAFATYIIIYLPGLSFMGVDLLKRVLRVPTTIEQQFRAQKHMNEIRMALGIRTHAHSVRSSKARAAHRNVLLYVNRFWVKLTEPSVNVKEVSELADEISTRRRTAIGHFDLALRRQQTADPVLLRRLGDFFTEILVAPDAAQECYEESKDILEARQARSMRGTRAHTTEVDLIALTERHRSLLDTHSKSSGGSQSNNTASTNLMKYFSVVVAVFFLVLITCSALLLFVAQSLKGDMDNLLAATMAITSLRITASRFGSSLIGYTMLTAAEHIAIIRPLMYGLVDLFASDFEFITTGAGKPSSTSSVYLMVENTIPFYSFQVGNTFGFSLRSMSEAFLQGMRRFMNESATTHPTGYGDNAEFIIDSGTTLSEAFGNLLTLQTTSEMSTLARRWIIWLVIIFIVALLCLVFTYAALVLAFHRTSMTRVLTFQLFTLIPYEALERLATEAKERYHQIHMEKSFNQSQEKDNSKSDSHMTNVEKSKSSMSPKFTQQQIQQAGAGDAGADGASAVVAGSTDAAGENGEASDAGRPLLLMLNGGAGAPLKSCLKSSNATASAGVTLVLETPHVANKKDRRVCFNPVVEVVGGNVDAGKEGKDAAAKRAPDDDDAGEGIDVLLLSGAGGRGTAAKKKETIETNTTQSASRWTMLFFFVILIAFAGSAILIGVAISGPMQYNTAVEEYRSVQSQLNNIFLRMPRMMTHTMSFIRAGTIIDFQNAMDQVSYAIQDIPNIMGAEVPLSITVALTQMHHLAQQMANLSIDVCVLASSTHGVNLAYRAAARTRAQLSSTALQTLLQTKYPGAFAYVNNMKNDFGGLAFDANIVNAYAIWYLEGTNISDTYRSTYYSMMEELTEDADLGTLMAGKTIIGALILSCIAVAFSLIMFLSPLQKIIRDLVSPGLTLFTAVSFLPVLAMCVVLIATNSAQKVDQLSPFTDSIEALDNAMEALVNYNTEIAYFIQCAMSNRYFQAMSIPTEAAKQGLSNAVIRDYATDPEMNALLVDVLGRWWQANRYNNISAALAISAFSSPAFASLTDIEQPMLDALAATEWDFSLESNYARLSAIYTPAGQTTQTAIQYTSKTQDLQLSPIDQYRLAVNTSTAEPFTMNYLEAVNGLSQMYSKFIESSYQYNRGVSSRRMTLIAVALALCVLPLIAFIFLGAAALQVVRISFQVTVGSSGSHNAQLVAASSSSESARYGEMLFRARIALFVLGVLFAVVLALGVWITQTGYVFSDTLTATTERQTLVSSTFYHLRQLYIPQLSYTTPSMVQQELSTLSDVMATIMGGHSRTGVPVGFYLSEDVNVMNFGPTDWDAQRAIVTSYMKDNCSRWMSDRPQPLPLRPEPNYGGGLTVPLGQALSTWIVSCERLVALMNDMTSSSIPAIKSGLDGLNVLSVPLMPALSDANNQMVSALEKVNRTFSDAFIAITAITLAGTLAVYCFVVVPTITRLFREEESLRMLLHMIPQSVRDEVPAISQFMETGQVSNMAALQKKFDANEKLLQNILPEKIAARLKSGEQPIADTHESVTMLFTDFVGFTKRSSTMQAREIVDFLNEVFLEFDTIVELLNLEKIKTIGDAFFMAGGLDPLVTDHALRVVEAGLKFFEALEEHNRRHPSRQPLQMRLGIHTGPVVAGVIGTKKVAYDLWGDSVEIANALETTGVPGYVHISEDTAKYVRGFFRLRPRGELPREKDHIPENMPKTYLVVGREIPTPYMHMRRPRLLPTNFSEKQPEKEDGGKAGKGSGSSTRK